MTATRAGFLEWLLRRVGHLTMEADAAAAHARRDAGDVGQDHGRDGSGGGQRGRADPGGMSGGRRRTGRRPSVSTVASVAGSVVSRATSGTAATGAAVATVALADVRAVRQALQLLTSLLVGTEAEITEIATVRRRCCARLRVCPCPCSLPSCVALHVVGLGLACRRTQKFGLAQLLRRMLITFASCSRSPHTRRWLNDLLGVVVNFVSHGDAAKKSLLRGASSGGVAVAHGPSCSLLHALLTLHRRANLPADVRALCCDVLRSAALESNCRGVMLKVRRRVPPPRPRPLVRRRPTSAIDHGVTRARGVHDQGDLIPQLTELITGCLRTRPKRLQTQRSERLAMELRVLVNLTFAPEAQLEAMRSDRFMPSFLQVLHHQDGVVVQAAAVVVCNCAFHKANAVHFLHTETGGVLERLVTLASARQGGQLSGLRLQTAAVAASALRALAHNSSKVGSRVRRVRRARMGATNCGLTQGGGVRLRCDACRHARCCEVLG